MGAGQAHKGKRIKMSDAAPKSPAPEKAGRAKTTRSVPGKALVWVLNAALVVVSLGVLLVGAAVYYLKGNPLTAPDWARDMIEQRLAEAVPQARVQFADVAVLMDDDWNPQLLLRDVAINSAAGEEVVRFNEVQARFAAAPLLEGKVRPSQIALSGIVARLRRGGDGSMALSMVGEGVAAERRAATLPELIGQVDDLLTSQGLQALRDVDVRALTLRYEDEGADRAWTVDGGRLRMTREGSDLTLSADLALLSGGAGVATLAANYTSQIGETAADFGVRFEDVAAEDIAAQGAAFAWLGVLRAPISGSVRAGLNGDGRFEPLAASLQIGKGAVQPDPGTPPIPFEGAQSYFTYDPAERLLEFDALSVRSKWLSADAAGNAALKVDPATGRLVDLVGQITLSEITASPADLYPEPVSIAAAEADFRLRLNPFQLTVGRAQVRDEGQVLEAKADVIGDPDGWRVAVDGRMDAIAPERLLALWPEQAIPGTRKWLDANLLAGDIRNIDVALRRGPDTEPQFYLAFDYDRANVRFSKNLPPVEDGRGHFSLADNRLVVALDAGRVTPPTGGAIAVTGSSFIIPDVRAKDGTPAVVRLQTRSSVTSTLSLLNMPPLSAMDKANLPVALAEGEAALSATLALTMKPGTPPKVQFHAGGDLLALTSDVLVRDRVLKADRLAIAVDNASLSLRGPGTLDGVAFDAVYAQPIGAGAGPGRLSGDLVVTPTALETFGVRLPEGSVAGSGRAELVATLSKGKPPAFELRSDLRGLRVNVPQVSWSKPANRAGDLLVAGTLGETPQIDTLDISGPGLTASGSVSFGEGNVLDRVRFEALEVGNWLNVPLDLVGQGPGKPLQVVMRGGALDLRRAAFGPGASTPGAPPMELALDRLQVTDTIALTGMQGRFDITQGLDGTFRAALNNGARVEGRVVPQDGRSAIRITSANAGDVLRAAGLLNQVDGGNLQLLLLPVGSGGAFDGRLTVSDVTIKDAPGIAALLNAVSVVGLVNELNGDGIYFDDVEATFRLTPDQLTLTQASAVGASMGLSMDGTYKLDSKQLAMQGVISPVFLLNGIGALFTRKGEGLIGFNYALSGQASKPQVSVNPLSALTPAMFREIFRAPPPELPEVDGVSESTLPEAAPSSQRPVAQPHEGR